MLKLSVCLQVNGKTVFWKCWKLFLKNFILRSSKSGGCQDDFSGLVSSFKLPHNNICFNETNIRKISLNQPYIRVSLFDFSFYIRY